MISSNVLISEFTIHMLLGMGQLKPAIKVKVSECTKTAGKLKKKHAWNFKSDSQENYVLQILSEK